jgi:hypothetical protein
MTGKRMSARDKIRNFFEENLGKVVTTHDISEVAGIRDYPRRIRELREKEGMQIKSHNDRTDLKPGEYILETLERLPVFEHGISSRTRAEVLARNGFTWYRLIRSTAQELSCIPIDSNLSESSVSRLVSAPNGTIYMLTDKGYKRGFVSADVFTGLGYSWSEVRPISSSELAAYPDDPVAPVLTSPLPDGTLVQASGSTTVYVITNGKKRGITSANAFQALGYDWNRIVVLPAATFNSIGEIQPAIDDNMLWCH